MSDLRGQTAPTPTPSPDDFSGFYGGAVGIGALPVMRGPEDMPDAPDSPWLDTLGASFRLGLRDLSGYNIQQSTDEYAPLVNALSEATGTPWTHYVSTHSGQTDRAGVWRDVEAWRTTHPGALPNFPRTRAEYDRQTAAKTKVDVAVDTQVVDHGPMSAWLLGGMGAGMLDPINLGTMFIGGPFKSVAGGPVKQFALRVLGEGLLNAGVEAIEQPLVAAERAERGESLSFGEAATNVGVAAGAGSAFQGLIAEPIAALLKRFVKAVPVEQMTDAERGGVSVLQRGEEIEATSPFTPGAGTEAHTARLDAAMRDVASNLPGAVPTPSPRASLRSGTSLGSGVVTGAPAAPGVDVSVAQARQQFMVHVRQAESSGNDAASNPRSSAQGRYQFTDETWLRYHHRVIGGQMSDAERLAQKRDGAVQDRLMVALTADNAAHLRGIGARETAGNLYLEHFAGQGGAAAILRAAPDTPIERLLSPRAIEANPFLRGKSAHDVIQWAHRRMGENVGDAPVVRRDQFPEGDEGDAEWQAAQHASDLAEAEYERVRQEQYMREAYLAEPGERRALRAEMAAEEAPVFDDVAPVRRSEPDYQSAYLADAGERQVARAGLAEPQIDPDVIAVRGDYGLDEVSRPSLGETPVAPPERTRYVIEATHIPRQAMTSPDRGLRTVYVSSRGAERIAAREGSSGATVELDEGNGSLLLQSDRGLEAIPYTTEPSRGGRGVAVQMRATAKRAAPGTAWAAALDHGATVAQRAKPVAKPLVVDGGEDALGDTIGSAFSNPVGPASLALAHGISHDVQRALETGELGDIPFAADGVETAHGGVEPRYRSARAVLAELDADEAAIAALEACL